MSDELKLTGDEVREICRMAKNRNGPSDPTQGMDYVAATLEYLNRRPAPEQSGEAREQLESARRVLKVLDDEASKRRQKYGSAIYSARDVDPDVYDIAKRIIDRAAMDRSALGREG